MGAARWAAALRNLGPLRRGVYGRDGSSSGMLRASISRPFLVAKADAAGFAAAPRRAPDWQRVQMSAYWQIAAFGPRGRFSQLSAINRHNRRLFDDLGGAQQNRWGYLKTERLGGRGSGPSRTWSETAPGDRRASRRVRCDPHRRRRDDRGLPGRLRRRANRRLWQSQIAHRPPVRCFGRRQYDRRAMHEGEYIRHDDKAGSRPRAVMDASISTSR